MRRDVVPDYGSARKREDVVIACKKGRKGGIFSPVGRATVLLKTLRTCKLKKVLNVDERRVVPQPYRKKVLGSNTRGPSRKRKGVALNLFSIDVGGGNPRSLKKGAPSIEDQERWTSGL